MRGLKKVGFMLFSLLPSTSWAETAPSAAIVGPDGTQTLTPARRPAQPSLEQQLQKRQRQEQNTPPAVKGPDATEPATSAQELLGPGAPSPKADPSDSPEPDPGLRMSLGLSPAQGRRVAGPIKTWRFEPGIVLENSWRLSDPKKSWTVWGGMRLGAWNGTASSTASYSRFAVVYIGPLLSFSWSPRSETGVAESVWRQSLSISIAGASRQQDGNFPGKTRETRTQPLGLDGSGLSLAYGLAGRITRNFEWEAKLGLQMGRAYMLNYASLGVSLWTD